MSSSSLAALNHAAQQQATGLHAQLSQLLAPAAAAAQGPASTSGSAAAPEQEQQQQLALQHLQSLSLANAGLARVLAAPSKQQQPRTTEELEEVEEACGRREQLLAELLQLLDSSSQALRVQLDGCHKLLAIPPCMQDAERIIRYAHTLRYGFAPLGSTPGLWQVPPAPQIPFMLHSTLRQYHMELAAQQQQPGQEQQQAQLPADALPQQAAAGALGAAMQQQDGFIGQQPQLPQKQAPLPAAIPFMLNPDLDDADDADADEDLETASEEEFSEEDYSDD